MGNQALERAGPSASAVAKVAVVMDHTQGSVRGAPGPIARTAPAPRQLREAVARRRQRRRALRRAGPGRGEGQELAEPRAGAGAAVLEDEAPGLVDLARQGKAGGTGVLFAKMALVDDRTRAIYFLANQPTRTPMAGWLKGFRGQRAGKPWFLFAVVCALRVPLFGCKSHAMWR